MRVVIKYLYAIPGLGESFPVMVTVPGHKLLKVFKFCLFFKKLVFFSFLFFSFLFFSSQHTITHYMYAIKYNSSKVKRMAGRQLCGIKYS